eukprot:9785491-Lingulodinium_polyedra.AAC.1
MRAESLSPWPQVFAEAEGMEGPEEVWAALYEKRHTWKLGSSHGPIAFKVRIPGGAWTQHHRGVPFD